MNEPGFQQATEPDQFGLYLDRPVSTAPDGTNPAVDGLATGVIGFRLFPNPNFDEAAKKNWDAKRYYTDPSYFQNPKLVRPYRVGMTCALCHVAFHPLKPPEDPEAPRWENLSSTLGNQYLRTRGVFGGDLKPDNFMYHILEAAHPGTIETSIIATDNNNNPNIVNSIYNVRARLAIATEETMAGPAIDFPPGGKTRRVPHILVDGADSIGVPGALDRVFVNIGMFGEEWVRCHNPIVGGRAQKPFSIPNAQQAFRLLAGDGRAHTQSRRLPHAGERPDAAARGARGREIFDHRPGIARPRQDRFRGELHAPATRANSRRTWPLLDGTNICNGRGRK